jgi:hypothetical protein
VTFLLRQRAVRVDLVQEPRKELVASGLGCLAWVVVGVECVGPDAASERSFLSGKQETVLQPSRFPKDPLERTTVFFPVSLYELV